MRFVAPGTSEMHLASTHSIVVAAVLRIMAHEGPEYSLRIPFSPSAQEIASFELTLLMRAGFLISGPFRTAELPYLCIFLKRNETFPLRQHFQSIDISIRKQICLLHLSFIVLSTSNQHILTTFLSNVCVTAHECCHDSHE